MRKSWLVALIAIVSLLAVACGGKKEESTLTVGASQVPHAEILEHIKPQLEREGVKLNVKVFQDYVLPNKAVEEGQLDANYFQHVPWLETTNKEKGYHIVKVVGVHIEPMGAYSKKWKEGSQIPNGATVTLPNDPSNLKRALQLLETKGLIKLDSPDGEKTLQSIKENPKKLQFKQLEAAMLPRTIGEVDLAVINTNYALQAKLNPIKDALFIEDKNSPYVNILATKQGNENKEVLKKLAKVLNSPEVKKFIDEKYKGAVVAAF
ncbi:MetQ/NlpA family ABC transporter substrate-binding protein [Thermoactinomyces sp. DSM 45892]|uniref:MetQ/NlpA family ABC transporter substrate-binding protein n=1 Tax=Thermoactinomyces sp. DSM 45892 TaxID=1882753 RepID=UPI0008993AAF|nr:MetQ/NlpA family ABC transporter substrate-binding protein [Thermoactinomyces sp. DSM 45892]SDZ21175.1 D-methionine transport system substrate-binding protein [Thermoactinomyces sp. DSM 45892]